MPSLGAYVGPLHTTEISTTLSSKENSFERRLTPLDERIHVGEAFCNFLAHLQSQENPMMTWTLRVSQALFSRTTSFKRQYLGGTRARHAIIVQRLCSWKCHFAMPTRFLQASLNPFHTWNVSCLYVSTMPWISESSFVQVITKFSFRYIYVSYFSLFTPWRTLIALFATSLLRHDMIEVQFVLDNSIPQATKALCPLGEIGDLVFEW